MRHHAHVTTLSNRLHLQIPYQLCTSHRNFSESQQHVTHVRSSLSSDGRTIPYARGWAWQHVLLERRLTYLRMQQQHQQQTEISSTTHTNSTNNAIIHNSQYNKDWLLLFEHDPVYTLGRGASEDHLTFLNNGSLNNADKDATLQRLRRNYRGEDASRLKVDTSKLSQSNNQSVNVVSVEDDVNNMLSTGSIQTNPVYAPNGAPIYRIERGGEVTYHGPGQLVLYPLLNLRHSAFKQDLHWYLRNIEEVVIQTLNEFGIDSNRDSINTGVWVGQNKIAAVGVSSSRWITTHGCAINVSPNLDHFDKEIITPCGIEERGVTCINNVLREAGEGKCPSVKEVADVAVKCFGEVFGVDVEEGDPIR